MAVGARGAAGRRGRRDGEKGEEERSRRPDRDQSSDGSLRSAEPEHAGCRLPGGGRRQTKPAPTAGATDSR
jgi:hypothetical protein